jgi:hypothetical protein
LPAKITVFLNQEPQSSRRFSRPFAKPAILRDRMDAPTSFDPAESQARSNQGVVLVEEQWLQPLRRPLV